jgi:hypothetical protein
VQFTAFGLAALLLIDDYLRFGPSSLATSLVCVAAGLLMGWPLAKWWLIKPTVKRALLACVIALLVLFGCAASTLVLKLALLR